MIAGRAVAAAAGAAVRGVLAVALAAAAACSVVGSGAGCAAPREPAPAPREPAPVPPGAQPPGPRGGGGAAAPDASGRSADLDQRLAAIQKAMNELDKAAQQCWAVAATERFDIAGEITLQIDIADGPAQPSRATVIRDTAHHAGLSDCLVRLMAAYRWAPPLYGQAIQLPFQFRAPDGQNTIDRALVAWRGQGTVSVAVLLDENNSSNAAASMFELAIAAGGTTGLRRADRAELWYFLAAGRVASPAGGSRAVAAGDMMYVPRGGVRAVSAAAGDLHAMIAVVPGGREGAARGGALPTPEASDAGELGGAGGARGSGGAAGGARPGAPVILPASAARTHGAAAIYGDAAQVRELPFAAAVLTLPAGTRVAEHVHAGQTELLYLLAGGGTLTVSGVDLPVTSTSVVQIPRNTRHALVATSEVRAVQIYTPAAPEQRYKAHP